MHHRKNRRVGSDGKSQGQDGRTSEGRRLPEPAKSVNDVTPRIFDETPSPDIARRLFEETLVAKSNGVSVCRRHFFVERKLRFQVPFEISVAKQLEDEAVYEFFL